MIQSVIKINETYSSAGGVKKDGISYPERLMSILLDQHYDGEYKREVTSNELFGKPGFRYDFVVKLPDGKNVIIEMQGRHHYEEVKWGSSPRTKTLTEVKSSDKKKKELAISNGVEPAHYLQINCRKGAPKSIQKSIISSEVLTLFRITSSSIDWSEIHEQSYNSIHQEIIRFGIEYPNAPTRWIANSLSITVSTDLVNKVLRENNLNEKHNKSKRRDRSRQNERQKRVVAFLTENSDVTGPDVAKELGVHRSTVYEIMRAQGIEVNERNLNARLESLRNQKNEIMENRIEEIRAFCVNNPNFTRAKIARHLGETFSWIHQVFRKHEIGINMEQMLENERKDSLINRKARTVLVVIPSGEKHQFDSINEARRVLSVMYNSAFPDSSVRRCIQATRNYNGFQFICKNE